MGTTLGKAGNLQASAPVSTSNLAPSFPDNEEVIIIEEQPEDRDRLAYVLGLRGGAKKAPMKAMKAMKSATPMKSVTPMKSAAPMKAMKVMKKKAAMMAMKAMKSATPMKSVTPMKSATPMKAMKAM